MIIKHRDKTLVSSIELSIEKRLMVLDWLLEFRFSTVTILSERLNQSVLTSSRFFRRLVDDGYVVPFRNIHMPGTRCLALTKVGVLLLQASGRDIERASIQPHKFTKYALIAHDLAVQKLVLSRLNSYLEVIWDRNISFGKHRERPDALLRIHADDKAFWSALEFERWRKSDKRIFYSFMLHNSAFKQGFYNGVIYVFQDEVDYKHYKKLFDQSAWPTYKKSAKNKVLTRTGDSFEPDSVPFLRDHFIFKHEPVE